MALDAHFGLARRLSGASGLGRTPHQLIADDRIRAAARVRSQRRWLNQQRKELLSLHSVAVAAAQRNQTVVITTRAGATFRGPVRALAREFCVVAHLHSQSVYIPMARITSLITRATDRQLAARQPLEHEVLASTFAEAIELLAADGDQVQIRSGTQLVNGRLSIANPSLLGVSPSPDSRQIVWLRLSAIDYVVATGEP